MHSYAAAPADTVLMFVLEKKMAALRQWVEGDAAADLDLAQGRGRFLE